ncbi:hypothetical protein P4114_30240 [Pseudomonas aeruginosa]|nr:hypothetical protein [Pseudomonas aeruginosa]
MEHGLLAEFDAFGWPVVPEVNRIMWLCAARSSRRVALRSKSSARRSPASAPLSGCSLASASRRISSTMACFAASPHSGSISTRCLPARMTA